jgi:hypothetical protein
MGKRVGPERSRLRDSRPGSLIAIVPARDFACLPPEERRACYREPANRSAVQGDGDGSRACNWVWTLLLVWYAALLWGMWYLVTRA